MTSLVKCSSNRICIIGDSFYKDILRTTYGIGNVRITFKDLVSLYLNQNQNLLLCENTYNHSSLRCIKTIDVKKQLLLGYELYTY